MDSSVCIRCRPSAPIRRAIKSSAFTPARIRVAVSSSVEHPGSSSDASSSFSNATLIRSGGWFFFSAVLRIVAAAIARARTLSYFTPCRTRT